MVDSFGALLREFRLRVGLTQDELADRSGVSAHSISVLEAGRRRPRLSSVTRLADALELEPNGRTRLIAAAHGRAAPAAPTVSAVSAVSPASAGPPPARPLGSGSICQLPSDTRLFTGRSQELDQLLALAERAPEGSDAGMVVISAIDGMGGVGKSALAIRAAHRVRAGFPDGQLFIDLHGHTPGTPPLGVGEALDWLLRSLGVPPRQIPQDVGQRAAFYRDRLADTRTLIVLDNAASTAQVRPLLPGTPGSLVLITSRKRLIGLDDAQILRLDVLPDAEAVALLHAGAGPGRIPADHPRIAELVALCGRLPLAIRITAARLRHSRTLRVEDLVEELRDEVRRLDNLADEDRNLTAVFETSYATLPPDEQLLFRRLGRVPGSDVDAHAAAGLMGTDHRTAERLLESLLDHHLLIQHTPGRYQFHDLLGLYARTLRGDGSGDGTAGAGDDEALERILDYYQHTSQLADRRLARRTPPRAPLVPATPASAPELPDRTTALAWLRAERDNLLAVTAHAAARDQPARAIALTAALAAYLLLDGPWTQAAALHEAAAAAAHDTADRLGEAGALRDLGRVRHATGDYQASAELYGRALTIYHDLANRPGEAGTLHELGRVKVLTGDYLAAADLHERALAIFTDLGDRLGEAHALCDLGRARHSTGDSPAAISLMERVLAIYRDLGDRRGEAGALHDLGYVLHDIGDARAAADLHERSLVIYQAIGSRQGEANALWNLGRARHETGDFAAAADLHERALGIYRALGSRQGEADALHGLGRARHRTGDVPAAADLYEHALAIHRSVGSRPGEAELLSSMGALAADTSGPDEALRLYQAAIRLARQIHSPLLEARALEGAARCTPDRATALTNLRQALATYRRIGAPDASAAAAHLSALEDGAHRA
ncbi:tetratricopeptide repeat protein [Kitasatospora sp. SUK 42]|uniref:ATP-binding protein n=1 Tax=Kitasatospora sp. SUK 42 TaxID=1588882 RepID=UPI001C317836|nr:tetratricopeptide repeat protein [Kitasatospora sp. SUK 42]MBV2151259.1 tetratricopeptide repeat protein [Kitasatospora sp. SUK 42]